MRYRAAFLGAVLVLMFPVASGFSRTHAQELGTIDFPDLRPPAAQPPFIRGVLLASQLRVRRREGSVCRGAEDRPGVRDGVLGRGDDLQPSGCGSRRRRIRRKAALAKLAPTLDGRLAKAPTAKEKDWLASLEPLYGAGDKLARDLAYADGAARHARKVSGRPRGHVVLRAGAARHEPRRPRLSRSTCAPPRSSSRCTRRTRSIPARCTT